MAVLEKLKTKDPNHPIFAMEDDEKLLKHDVLLTEDRFGGGKHSIAILDALNEAFFQDMSFRGNTANYYNPANSFIDKVLENRQGIYIVKLGNKERFDKEQIGIKEPFPLTNLPFTS